MEPWGLAVDDFHFAQIVQSIAETNRNPKKRGQKYKIEDFIPKWDEPSRRGSRKATTESQMLAMVETFERQWRAAHVESPEGEAELPAGTILGPDGKPVR